MGFQQTVERAMNVSYLLNAIVWAPWAVLLAGVPLVAYWQLEPVPLEIKAVAPHFADREVSSMEEAAQHAVTEIPGGTLVFRYVEYCVRKPFDGHSHRAWVTRAFVWHVPNGNLYYARRVGCFSINTAVEVPTSNPTRTFEFRQSVDVRTNPIRTDVVTYEPILLTVLKN